jgi:hypothetical protein
MVSGKDNLYLHRALLYFTADRVLRTDSGNVMSVDRCISGR